MTKRLAYLVNAATAAAVSAAAIFASPEPALARDKDKDLLKLLAGAAAVAIVAGVIQNRANAGASAPVITRNAAPELYLPPTPRPIWNDQPGWQSQDDLYRPAPVRGGQRLPAACALEFGSPRPATYYAESCLRREGLRQNLPQFCAQQIRSRDWQGKVYDGDCLREAGFREERWN